MTKKIRVVVIEAGNPVLKVIEKFESSLEDSQAFVGGYIEAIRVNDSITIWINEEGKMIELEPNFYLVNQFNEAYDMVVGNVFICGTDEEGDNISLTDEEVEEIKERFTSRIHFRM